MTKKNTRQTKLTKSAYNMEKGKTKVKVDNFYSASYTKRDQERFYNLGSGS